MFKHISTIIDPILSIATIHRMFDEAINASTAQLDAEQEERLEVLELEMAQRHLAPALTIPAHLSW